MKNFIYPLCLIYSTIMLATQKRIFHSPRKVMLFIMEEFLLVSLLIYLAYKILGIRAADAGIELFAIAPPFQDVIWFWTILFLFLIVYFGIARRDELVCRVHREFSGTLWRAISEKTSEAKKENVVLVVAEFAFVAIIAISIFIYLDPEINIVAAPYNYVAFAAFLAFSVFLYSKTRQFREAFYGPSLAKRVLLRPESHNSFRRLTNRSTGHIRIASKHHYDSLARGRPAFFSQGCRNKTAEGSMAPARKMRKAPSKRKPAKKR